MDQLDEWKVYEYFCDERSVVKAEKCLPNRVMDALVVDVLCRLIAASLKEDTYGTVQRDIPRILEALLSFMTAVEELGLEIQREGSSKGTLDYRTAGDTIVTPLQESLGRGLRKVVETFGDKLTAFKFPVKTAKKLQGYLDYS